MPPIYISFTSTPDRLPHIMPMLESLKQQTFKQFKTILWICDYYTRSKKNFSLQEVPGFIKNDPFLSIQVCPDYGSNTKLYPLLQSLDEKDAIIVTADDDTLYPARWLEGLVEASLNDPSKAYGYRGKVFQRRSYRVPLTPLTWKKPLSYRASKTVMLGQEDSPQEVDVLTGVWGILYRRSFFDDGYFNLSACPEALHNDDLWANGHLAKQGISRLCLGCRDTFADIPMEKHGIKRLWDSINNGKGLNDKVLTYFKKTFDRERPFSQSQ